MNSVATNLGVADAVVHLSGFLFVLLVLSVLWMVVAVIGNRFNRQERIKVAAAAATLAAASAAVAGESTPSLDNELAAVSTAVTLLLGEHSRMVSIRPAGIDWGREGRRQHVQSHSIRQGFSPVMARARRWGLSTAFSVVTR